jgi:DNA-binding IclR family transcriptional regulator
METTVLKTLRVIEALGESDKPRGITELSRELKLTKSNVHRLIETLAASGYVYRREGGRYELTLKLWELGMTVVSRLDLKEVAAPHLRELAARTAETVHLSVFDDGSVVYIEKIESSHPVRAYSRVGGRAPAYCVATGKALLAYQPPELINRIARTLIRFTRRTITNPEGFVRELERIKRDGYAVNQGEWRDSVCGVAAPIWDGSGVVVAAVGISGPVQRLPAKACLGFAPVVVAAAQRISHDLGYRAVRMPRTSLKRDVGQGARADHSQAAAAPVGVTGCRITKKGANGR